VTDGQRVVAPRPFGRDLHRVSSELDAVVSAGVLRMAAVHLRWITVSFAAACPARRPRFIAAVHDARHVEVHAVPSVGGTDRASQAEARRAERVAIIEREPVVSLQVGRSSRC